MHLFAIAEWQIGGILLLVLVANAIRVLGNNATAKSAARKGATHFLDKWFK